MKLAENGQQYVVASRLDEYLARPNRKPYMVWSQVLCGGEGYDDFDTIEEAKALCDEINGDESEVATVYGPDGQEVHSYHERRS